MIEASCDDSQLKVAGAIRDFVTLREQADDENVIAILDYLCTS